MEMEVDANALPEGSVYDFPSDNDDSNLENERCGICMDVVVDRGVLDCCQHWFCFVCIDNWATITNLCPLCQNEFQLITCVPVYDTIGSSKVEDDSFNRDDEWFIQEKNNTLSFPSYYIDENAVICLDGDGCKIRNGLTSTMEDTNLDTSIACDSCDIWYHAFCVGFDPESTSESSWLCPRCLIDDLPQKSDHVAPTQILNKQHGPETASHECLSEASISGKLSVSVADAGETAIVVSMIEGMQSIDEHAWSFLSVLNNNEEKKTGTPVNCTGGSSSTIEMQMNKNIDSQSNLDSQDTSLALSLSRDVHFLPCNSLPGELKTTSFSKAISDPNGANRCTLSSSLVSVKANSESGAPDSVSKLDLQLGLSVGCSFSGLVNNEATENQLSAVSECIEDSSLGSVDKMATNASEEAPGVIGAKRKSTNPRVSLLDQVLLNDSGENDDIKNAAKMLAPTKKARLDGNSRPSTLTCEIKCSSSVGTMDDKSRNVPENEEDSSDIMSIVRGAYQRPTNGLSHPRTADKSSREKGNGCGLRVKKIMCRAAEDDSSKLLEKLREEIKEAVRNKSTKDITKSNLFDPKLLAAFRAVIAGPQTAQAPVNKSSPLIVRTKKSLLQKGKIRENLTKKIYGTVNGKRRRAWDRDWEVEFWKHRCNASARPEKVETLKSVLDLLMKNSENSETEKETEQDGGNAILSRLYLADTSVFPRKDDIKPLSVLSGQKNHETVVKDHNLNEKVSKSVNSKCNSQIPAKNSKCPSQACTSFDKLRKDDVSKLKDEAASQKMKSNGSIGKKSSVSMSNGSQGSTQSIKVMPSKSDVKTDKRKWALEILARKNATAVTNATRDKHGDNAMLKGNFPLLAQLPEDMRPVLATSHHNKVPVSVRQAQLYRLAEHFLRKTNLPVIQRSADTELAIADAINIEKDIADKSNSKLVYVNLCSQVLSQYANNNSNKRPSDDMESNQTGSATKEPCPDLSAEEALRLAGLADSPPSSPRHTAKRLNNDDGDDDDDDEPSKMAREGPENVFDMDTHQPDLDIYGDFEYDLDDDCINDPILEVPKSQPEDTDMKMKVVFSTLTYDKTNDEPTYSKDLKALQNTEAPTEPQCLESHSDKTLGLRANASSPSAEPLQGGIGELSLAECEELYGPDKEPLSSRFPDMASREANVLENEVHGENLNHSSNNNALAIEMEGESCAENIFDGSRLPADQNSSGGETSPNHSLTNKNVKSKEKRTSNIKQSDIRHSISKKVEVYIKEHIRPLCKSGVITSEQYRWAVAKTTEKVMRYHSKDKNANFLIKEGEKVKKLAEQYVEASQQRQGKNS